MSSIDEHGVEACHAKANILLVRHVSRTKVEGLRLTIKQLKTRHILPDEISDVSMDKPLLCDNCF